MVVMRFAKRKFERLLEGQVGAYKLALGMGMVLSDRHRHNRTSGETLSTSRRFRSHARGRKTPICL